MLFGVDFDQIRSPDFNVRVPVAMVGTFHRAKQKFTISRADIATMAANFAKRGNGEVVIDYEHASEQPEVAGAVLFRLRVGSHR